jgi:DNA-binding HxlR family transcriptional regulator
MDGSARPSQTTSMRPRASRPSALQSVTVLETLKGLAAQHGAAGVPFKELETAIRSRLDYRALTDALNALVNDGAVRRVTDKPARLAITEAGRKRLNEYRS